MDAGKIIQEILSDYYSLPYLLTLFAYIIHEILGLRLVLLGAHLGFFILAVTSYHGAGIFWNLIFIAINGYHVIRLLHGRRIIRFEPEVEGLYTSVFSSLSRSDFQAFWNLGRTSEVINRVILDEGIQPEALGVIVSGYVLVEKSHTQLNRLDQGRFFAEMGYLTRQKASATIRSPEKVKLHLWDFDQLDLFFQKNQPIYHGLQGILGRDMAQKIAEQNPR